MTIPYPEKDTDVLAPRPVDPYPSQPFVDLPVNGPIFPDNSEHAEIDTTMLPGVPGQRGPRGYIGPAGPGVPTGGAANQFLQKVSSTDYDYRWASAVAQAYTYTQNAVSSNWSITHNLGFYPNVTTVDATKAIMEGTVTYTDTNSLTVSFGIPTTGFAYLS